MNASHFSNFTSKLNNLATRIRRGRILIDLLDSLYMRGPRRSILVHIYPSQVDLDIIQLVCLG